MFHDFKSLLGDALSRHQMSRQVTTAQLLETATITLAEILPPGRASDARAVSFAHGTLNIVAANSPAGKFLSDRANQIRERIIARVPAADVREVKVRIGSVDVLE